MTDSPQYLLPNRLEVADVSQALAPSLAHQADSRAAGERSFYDTFDGRLHRAGLSLVHEAGRLALLEGGHSERAGTDQPRAPKRMLAADLPAGRLRDLLVPLVKLRALTRIARVRSRRRPLCVLNDEAELIRSLGDEVRELDDGTVALLAMGQLVERLEEEQACSRAEFAERFAAFASRRQQALARETFA